MDFEPITPGEVKPLTIEDLSILEFGLTIKEYDPRILQAIEKEYNQTRNRLLAEGVKVDEELFKRRI